MRYKNFNEELEFEQDITWEPSDEKTWVQPMKELNDKIAERIFEEMGISDFFVKLENEQSDVRYRNIASDWGLANEPDIRFRMPFGWGYGWDGKEEPFPTENKEWYAPCSSNYNNDPNKFFRTFDVVYMGTGALVGGDRAPVDTVRAKVDYDNKKIYYKVTPNVRIATNGEVVVIAHNKENTGARIFGYDNHGHGIVLNAYFGNAGQQDMFISKSWPWNQETSGRGYLMTTIPGVIDYQHTELSSVGDSEFNVFDLDLMVGWNDGRRRFTGIRIDTKDIVMIPSASRLGTIRIDSHNTVTIGNDDWYQVFGDIFVKMDKKQPKEV